MMLSLHSFRDAHYCLSVSKDWAGISSSGLSILFGNVPLERQNRPHRPGKHGFCIWSRDANTRGWTDASA